MSRFAAALAGACLAVLSVLPAAAQTRLDGAAFEALVTGWTLQFSSGGQSYGAEQYLPGRRVYWSFEGGECREGLWYEAQPGLICFSYEQDPEPQCWAFFEEEGRVSAEFRLGDETGTRLHEAGRSRAPLACPGPALGA